MMYEEFDPNTPIKLNLCRRCGKERVLKPGDYCRECAVISDDRVAEDTYIIVEPHTLEDTIRKTGIAKTYLQAKYARAQEMNCRYVVFYIREGWQDIVVSKKFYLPQVMETVFERLHD